MASDGQEDMIATKYEIDLPENEQTLIRQIDGRLVVSKDSYALMHKLVEAYQKEEARVRSQLSKRLKIVFISRFRDCLGERKFKKIFKPKDWKLEGQAIEHEVNS